MKNSKIKSHIHRPAQLNTPFNYKLIHFNFSENSNPFPTHNLRSAVIKETDNTIGLPDELLEDKYVLASQRRHKEIRTEDVSAGDDPSEKNEIALESRNLASGRSMRSLGIGRSDSKEKSFPHGYDKI
jgi:hypothetical protein